NAVGSASSISTSGYVLVTYDPSTSEDLGFNMNASVRLAEDTCTTTINPAASGGSSGGDSSSDDDDKTEVTTNPDGSTTTTVTKPDGTVTETTKYPNGSTSTTTVDKNGQVETEVSLSSGAISNAKDEPVALPMPEVPVTKDWDEAPVVTVSMTGYSEARVEIPV